MKPKREHGWVNNGTALVPHFNFSPPKHWSTEQILSEQRKIIAIIEEPNTKLFESNSYEWLRLIQNMPNTLKKILLSELQHKNKIVSISRNDWPNPGSIVINVSDRFQETNRTAYPYTHWRLLNDPHYYREEISESCNGIEYLLIA